MAFKRYNAQEISSAALAAGIDPFIFDAIYARESSRGTDPNAMRVRSVKAPQSGKTSLIMGPFQISSDTFRETALKHGLPLDYADEKNYLRVNALHARDIADAHGGDQNVIPGVWFGGAGANPNAKDENGKSVKDYSKQVLAEADRNRTRASGKGQPQGPAQLADNSPVGLLSKGPDSATPSLGALSDEGALGVLGGGTPDLQNIIDTTTPTRVARAGPPPVERDSLGIPLLMGLPTYRGDQARAEQQASDGPPPLDYAQIAAVAPEDAAAYHDPSVSDDTIERLVEEELSNRYPNG